MRLALQHIRRVPCKLLEPDQWFVLELHKFMVDVRAAANRMRMSKFPLCEQPHLQYLIGRVHGLWFGMSSQFIYSGLHDQMSEFADAAMNECDFLSNEYQWRES